jgi:CheY-like chemotaxis protein
LRFGSELLSATDGHRGLELARRYLPQVILMDLNLPGLNGTEVMRILRCDPATAHIPVIAITANAMPGDVKKGMDAGFFRYITKPIDLAAFSEAIDSALSMEAARHNPDDRRQTILQGK